MRIWRSLDRYSIFQNMFLHRYFMTPGYLWQEILETKVRILMYLTPLQSFGSERVKRTMDMWQRTPYKGPCVNKIHVENTIQGKHKTLGTLCAMNQWFESKQEYEFSLHLFIFCIPPTNVTIFLHKICYMGIKNVLFRLFFQFGEQHLNNTSF